MTNWKAFSFCRKLTEVMIISIRLFSTSNISLYNLYDNIIYVSNGDDVQCRNSIWWNGIVIDDTIECG